jgi:hypothetical protein
MRWTPTTTGPIRTNARERRMRRRREEEEGEEEEGK